MNVEVCLGSRGKDTEGVHQLRQTQAKHALLCAALVRAEELWGAEVKGRGAEETGVRSQGVVWPGERLPW